MCVYINDIEGYNWDFIRGVKANETSFTFNLNDISSDLEDGRNKLYFAPKIDNFRHIFEGDNYIFNPLEVNVVKDSQMEDYVSTPIPSEVYYTFDSSKVIEVNITYPDDADIKGYSMFVYINGEDESNRVKIEGVDSGASLFTFDLATVSDNLAEGLNNLTFHPNTGLLEYEIRGELIFNPLAVKATSGLVNTTLDVDSALNVVINKTSKIEANYTPSDAKITYVSSNESIVSVDENGVVKGLEIGNATINVTVGDGEIFAITTKTVNVCVTNATEEYCGVIYVSKDGNDDNEGSEYLPVSTISKAIELATADDNVAHKIIIREGTYEEMDLLISSDLEIIGENAIVDALNNSRILTINGSNVNISGITFANANIDDYGGAICIDDADGDIRIFENRFINCSALYGGAIYSQDSRIALYKNTMENCIASENGNNIYLENGEITTETILKISEGAIIKLGENITIDATLTDDNGNTISGGEITLTANGEKFNESATANGTVSSVFVPKAIGNYTISGSYGMANNISIETVLIEVTAGNKEDANISARVNDTHIIVSLPEDAEGNVTVTIGDAILPAEIDKGNAVVEIPELVSGNYTAEITYSGDDKYNSEKTSVNFTVDEKSVPKENLTIEATADAINVGDDAVIVVTGLKNASGNVTAKVGNGIYVVPIVNGSATITVSGLIENSTAVISYAGDDKYNNASTTVMIVVNPKPKENATISIDAPEVTEGENATVSVTLPVDAEGTVTVGNETVSVENGTASVVISDLSAGNTTLPVTYSGDDKYNSMETEVTVTVKEVKSDIILAPDVTKYYKGSERFVVTVTDHEGNPLSDKTVIININGKDYTRTTDENGTASMALGLPSSIYNVSVSVDNQTVGSVVTILPTVNGTDVVKVYKNATQYYATFKDSEGKYLADGTIVKFNINGVMYERKVSGDKGLARLNINLPQGEYIITAINPENGEMAANNITVLSTITENRDITKYYKNATQYTVKVLGADGKAVGTGETVKFNINGVFYERTTNESGIAKLSINLPEGDYVITAEYNGCKVANSITVLPVLSAEDITMKYRDGTEFVVELLDGQGKAYAEQNIQFNINGVFYNKVTDSSGQAKLNINLLAGKYIITSSFNGANIANTITITA